MTDTTMPVIKIGILYSLTGTTGKVERGMYQATLLAIRQINDQGGVNGKLLQPVVEDIASDPYLAAIKADKLITTDKVFALFGTYTSACRKMVIPVLEKYNKTLFYPASYEGEEQHPNIIYCGSVPNQQLHHFIPWIIENLGQSFYLIGSDLSPRYQNIRHIIESKGGMIIGEKTVELGLQKFFNHFNEIQQLKPDVIFSTLIGDSSIAFYQQHDQYGLSQPIASTVTTYDHQPSSVEHYSCYPYFSSIQSEANEAFITEYRRTYGPEKVSSPMESAYYSVFLFAEAIKKVNHIETDSLKHSLSGLSFNAPQGKIVVDKKNQHLWLNSRIGKMNHTGQYTIIWESETIIPPIPFSEKVFTAEIEVPNPLLPEILDRKLSKYENLMSEFKHATHLFPYTFAFFDNEGILLKVFNNESVTTPAFVDQFIQGETKLNTSGNTSEIRVTTTGQPYHHITTTGSSDSELKDWISVGIPIKNDRRIQHGTLGLFFTKTNSETANIIINSISSIIKYCLTIAEKREKDSSYLKFLQDISGNIKEHLFVMNDGNIVFKNQSALELMEYKSDFIDSILREISLSSRDESQYMLRKEDSGDLYEVLVVQSWPNQYIYLKLQSEKSPFSFKHENKSQLLTKDIIGSDAKFLRTVTLAKSASEMNANVLILGESGTGKELFARAIHNESTRMSEPFVALNCAAISKDLINAELFGYEEGAFTGAKKGGRPGKFEFANGGTLFLDEIGDMPIELQATLLRVLQEKEVIRVGGHKPIPVDVRIIAATNKNLNQEIAYNGSFRSDLYFRLNVFTIELIPLHERSKDVPELAIHFIKELSLETGLPYKELSQEALYMLIHYPWPGNIRELNNVIERAFYLSGNSFIITRSHLPQDVVQFSSNISAKPASTEHIQSFRNIKEIKQYSNQNERTHIIQTLLEQRGNISQAAKVLGISRTTLYRKLDEYDINRDSL
ncbi:transporter substrate-binding protein [Sporosarcina sp. CAU 1771]